MTGSRPRPAPARSASGIRNNQRALLPHFCTVGRLGPCPQLASGGSGPLWSGTHGSRWFQPLDLGQERGYTKRTSSALRPAQPGSQAAHRPCHGHSGSARVPGLPPVPAAIGSRCTGRGPGCQLQGRDPQPHGRHFPSWPGLVYTRKLLWCRLKWCLNQRSDASASVGFTYTDSARPCRLHRSPVRPTGAGWPPLAEPRLWLPPRTPRDSPLQGPPPRGPRLLSA